MAFWEKLPLGVSCVQDSRAIALGTQVKLRAKRSSFSCLRGFRCFGRWQLDWQGQLLCKTLARQCLASTKQDLKGVQLHRPLYAQQRDDGYVGTGCPRQFADGLGADVSFAG